VREKADIRLALPDDEEDSHLITLSPEFTSALRRRNPAYLPLLCFYCFLVFADREGSPFCGFPVAISGGRVRCNSEYLAENKELFGVFCV
jgi:hypothetical protein